VTTTSRAREISGFQAGPRETPLAGPCAASTRPAALWHAPLARGLFHPLCRPATAGREENRRMDEQTFQTKFNELLDKIKDLPDVHRERFAELANETRERRDRIQNSVTELQESLDYLRLSVKYLVFDLEATRRENAYLRKLVEQANREQNDQKNNPNNKRRRRREDDNFLEEGDLPPEGSD
jgi:hypothetical protein